MSATKRGVGRRQTILIAAGAAVVVVLIVAGMAFVHSLSLSRVTDNARSLHWTNATLGTAALTRAGLAQAVTFTDLERRGLIGKDDLDFALDELGTALADLEQLHSEGVGRGSYDELGHFLALAEEARDHLDAGEPEEARSLVVRDLEPAYELLTEVLSAEQETVQAAIEANTETGRTLNAWMVFVLMLMVPATAIGVYFLIARRQVRAIRERARLELDAERRINRAKDEFIAGLSHELRTPLTSIYGFAEVLGDGSVKGGEATRETARLIASQAAEMTRMVDDLLVAARLAGTGVAVHPSPTVVDRVIESAVSPFERDGHIISRGESGAVVWADEGRLRQVLVNLLSNAVRHGAPPVAVEVFSDGDHVVLEVWDHGDGVPSEQEDRLFERFVHTGEAPLLAGSVGLGLAVASRLTRLLGGEIDYRREEGRTCFSVRLPAAEQVVTVESASRSGS